MVVGSGGENDLNFFCNGVVGNNIEDVNVIPVVEVDVIGVPTTDDNEDEEELIEIDVFIGVIVQRGEEIKIPSGNVLLNGLLIKVSSLFPEVCLGIFKGVINFPLISVLLFGVRNFDVEILFLIGVL